jgi:hypothetical protein
MHTIIFQINLYYRRQKYPCFRHTDISVTHNSNGIYNYRLEFVRIKYYTLQLLLSLTEGGRTIYFTIS